MNISPIETINGFNESFIMQNVDALRILIDLNQLHTYAGFLLLAGCCVYLVYKYILKTKIDIFRFWFIISLLFIVYLYGMLTYILYHHSNLILG